jgi:ABC-2 type transport system permease protein
MLLTADYLFATMGLCLIVAHFVTSQRTATTAILLILFIPSFFQTGLSLPIDKTSLGAQIYAYSLPATQFIIASRGVMLKALDLTALWSEALAMFVMGLVGVIVGILLFTKKIG